MDQFGKTIIGDNIPYLKIGISSNEVFYSASFHANEWITTPVLIKFISDYCYSITNNLEIYGLNAVDLFNTTTLYVVPMVNPDGVNLVNNFFPTDSWAYNFAKNISSNYPNIPFIDGWKANIRGVDLKSFQPFCKVL